MPIRTLTKRLGKGNPEWTYKQLPRGGDNPLVRAGVLVATRISDTVDCPDCNECAETPTVYSADPTAVLPRYAFTCPLDAVAKECHADWITIWKYDPERLAELVCEKFECENVTRSRSGMVWNLGFAKRAFGKNRRQVCIVTRIKSRDDPVLSDLPDGDGFILLVGTLLCDLPSDRFPPRRLYRFEDLLRFRDDGSLEVVFDEIENRFEDVAAAKKTARKANSVREGNVAKVENCLKDLLCAMISQDDFEKWKRDSRQITQEMIAKTCDLDGSTVSRILNDPGRTVAKTLFGLCKDEECLPGFHDWAQTQNKRLDKMSPEEIAMGFSRWVTNRATK